MKRKIIGIILTLILISSSFTLSVNAGSEKNPELEDETGECLRTIDIKSVWFFEKPDEPEYLYVNMKLANFKIFRMVQGFSIDFKINNESYKVILSTFFFFEDYVLAHEIRNGSNSTWYGHELSGQVKKINSIISWKVPKSLIGNPEAGDKITNMSAGSDDVSYFYPRIIIPAWILYKLFNISPDDIYNSEIPIIKKIKDYFEEVFNFAFDYTESNGKDYIIQYSE